MEEEDLVIIDSVETIKNTMKNQIKILNENIDNLNSTQLDINDDIKDKINFVDKKSERNSKIIKDILQLVENQSNIILNLEIDIKEMRSKLEDSISENKNLVEDKNKLQKRIVEIEKKMIKQDDENQKLKKNIELQNSINKSNKSKLIKAYNIIESMENKVYLYEKKTDIIEDNLNKVEKKTELNYDPSYCKKSNK